jgi:hypothetical protein
MPVTRCQMPDVRMQTYMRLVAAIHYNTDLRQWAVAGKDFNVERQELGGSMYILSFSVRFWPWKTGLEREVKA